MKSLVKTKKKKKQGKLPRKKKKLDYNIWWNCIRKFTMFDDKNR